MTARAISLRTAAALLATLLAVVAQGGPAQDPRATAAADSRIAAIHRGSVVYATYCATCHGPQADGRGRAAELHNPRPANLRTSDKNDAYFGLIVRRGGAALGRSAGMPPWSEELSNEQINDLVVFLRSVNTHRP